MSDLMADLKAAAADPISGHSFLLYADDITKLLALLEAGKAIRDTALCDNYVQDVAGRGNPCDCKMCDAARQYDEAAK